MSDYKIPLRDWARAFVYVSAVYTLGALCEWHPTAWLLRAFGGEWGVEVVGDEYAQRARSDVMDEGKNCKQCGGETTIDIFGEVACKNCIDSKIDLLQMAEYEVCRWCGEERLTGWFLNQLDGLLGQHYSFSESAIGALVCMGCNQVHLVYREDHGLRVDWIE